MSHDDTLEDKNRRNIWFHQPSVEEVLPSYFRSEYPNLITFLDKYYEFLDSDGNIGDIINHLGQSQDPDAVDAAYLDYLFGELTPDLRADLFDDPREVLKNLADFFRTRGTLYSAKAFFRALYGEEVEITYPKDRLLTVGVSDIGPEGDIIQDGALYQILSILVRSSSSRNTWESLYKKLVHPVGFYLGSEVAIDRVVALTIDAFIDSDEGAAGLFETATTVSIGIETPYQQMTGFYTDIVADSDYRINLDETIGTYDSETGAFVIDQYVTFETWTDPNSPTLDDSDIDLSNIIESIDQNKYDN